MGGEEVLHLLVRPHVVVLPLPNAQGHMNPMMQLAKRLTARGVIVTFITIEHAVARLVQASAGAGAAAGEVEEEGGIEMMRLIGVPDGLPADAERHVMSEEYVRMLETVGQETEARLRSLLADPLLPPITCVLADVFLDSASSMLTRLRLPRCAFWPMSATVLSIHMLLSTFRAHHGFDPLQREVAPFSPMDSTWPENSAYVTCVPGLPKLHKHYLPYYLGIGEIGQQATSNWIQNTINHLNEECICILGNDVQGLEAKQCQALGPKFFPVGPLIAPAHLGDSHEQQQQQAASNAGSFWKEDYADCMEWLDKQPECNSVVYVSFGSLTRLSKEQTLEVAQGLMESKQRFLWVLRKDAFNEAISDISEALPADFFETTKHHGKVVSWAPQMAVLRHSAVGAFFSHCGWNSVLESMVAGLPMLAWPQFSDQVTNCWMIVHEWQTGLELKRDFNNKPHPKEVAQALTTLMEGPTAATFRAKALLLKDVARRDILSDSGSSKQNLDMFTDLLYKMASESSQT